MCNTFCYPENEFPFVGKATVDNLNVRSGANKNFPSLYKLKKDSEVIVRGEQYGWYKISIPQNVSLYIARQYVTQKGYLGELKADNVNVRIKPNSDADVVGLLKKGDIVSIIGQENKFYFTIKPTFNSYGWVTKEFVKFNSPFVLPKPSENLPLFDENKTDKPKEPVLDSISTSQN